MTRHYSTTAKQFLFAPLLVCIIARFCNSYIILQNTTALFMLCWRLGVASKTVADSRHLLCIAVSLRDDFRAYLPELLPRFIGLFAEAERSGNYDQVLVLALSPSSPSSVPPHCFVMASDWPCIACTFSFLSCLYASSLFCYGFSLALHCLHILLLVHALCLPTVLLWLLIGLASLAHSPSCPCSVPPH